MTEKDASDKDDGKTEQGQQCNCTLRKCIGFPLVVRSGNASNDGTAGCSEATMNLLLLH